MGDRRQYKPVPTNGWLIFTEWENHLKDFGKELILSTIWPANGELDQETVQQEQELDVEADEEGEEHDRGLAIACKATRQSIRKAMTFCQPNIAGRSALEYVKRRETGESEERAAVYAKQKVAAIRKNTDVWLKILRYIGWK